LAHGLLKKDLGKKKTMSESRHPAFVDELLERISGGRLLQDAFHDLTDPDWTSIEVVKSKSVFFAYMFHQEQ
jgi:hypothetical protein